MYPKKFLIFPAIEETSGGGSARHDIKHIRKVDQSTGVGPPFVSER